MIPAPTPYDDCSNFIALAIHFSTGAMGIHRQSGAPSSSLRCPLGVSRLVGSSSSSILPLRFNLVFSGSSPCTICSATSSHWCAKELVPRNGSPNLVPNFVPAVTFPPHQSNAAFRCNRDNLLSSSLPTNNVTIRTEIEPYLGSPTCNYGNVLTLDCQLENCSSSIHHFWDDGPGVEVVRTSLLLLTMDDFRSANCLALVRLYAYDNGTSFRPATDRSGYGRNMMKRHISSG